MQEQNIQFGMLQTFSKYCHENTFLQRNSAETFPSVGLVGYIDVEFIRAQRFGEFGLLNHGKITLLVFRTRRSCRSSLFLGIGCEALPILTNVENFWLPCKLVDFFSSQTNVFLTHEILYVNQIAHELGRTFALHMLER